MKRYYLAEIEQVEEIPGETVYRCRASAYPDLIFEGGEILTDETGKPVNKFSLVLVKSRDHARIIADPKMIALPDLTGLDVEVSAIAKEARSEMIADFQRLGIDTTMIQSVNSFRKIIRELGKLNNPNFNENRFDVNE